MAIHCVSLIAERRSVFYKMTQFYLFRIINKNFRKNRKLLCNIFDKEA